MSILMMVGATIRTTPSGRAGISQPDDVVRPHEMDAVVRLRAQPEDLLEFERGQRHLLPRGQSRWRPWLDADQNSRDIVAMLWDMNAL